MFKRNLNKQKGSSLVELIVVMTIIGIIMSIAIVSYTVFIKNAKRVKVDQELTQVYNLIYMEANQFGVEIGRNNNNPPSPALYVTTSGNKIVLIFNDAPSKGLDEQWQWHDIKNWEDESNWNKLINDLINDVTGDINMFSGRFELDPTEDTAEEYILGEGDKKVDIIQKRNLTYILENDEELRSKKELIVTTLKDVETVTRFLSDLETDNNGNLVPKGRKVKHDDIDEIKFELWFVWTAAAGYVKYEEFIGDLVIEFDIRIFKEGVSNDDPEIIAANNIINNKEDPIFEITFEHEGHVGKNKITSDYPEMIEVTLSFKREPHNQQEYNLIKNSQLELVFTINIENVSIYKVIEEP